MVPLTEGAPTRHISVTEIERQRQRLRERQTQTQRLLRKTKTWSTLVHHLVTLVSLSQKHCHSFLRENTNKNWHKSLDLCQRSVLSLEEVDDRVM